MKSNLIAAAVAAGFALGAPGAQALTGEHFSVSSVGYGISLVSGSVLVAGGGIAGTDYAHNSAQWTDGMTSEWSADPGFVLDGFSVTYALRLIGASLGYWQGSGLFTASTGAALRLTADPAGSFSQLQVVSGRVTDEVVGPLASLRYDLTAIGLMEGECDMPGGGPCGAAYQSPGETITTLFLDSITITPHVTAIPEPSTYALMLLGLGAVLAARSGRRHAPARRHPLLRRTANQT